MSEATCDNPLTLWKTHRLVVGGEVLNGAAGGGGPPLAVDEVLVHDAIVHLLEASGLGTPVHGGELLQS